MKETHWNIDWSKMYDNIYTPVCLYAHQGCIHLIEIWSKIQYKSVIMFNIILI